MALAASKLKKHTPDFEPLGGLPRSQYGPKEGWLTFVIVLLLALSVVWSVETAHWLDGMPSYSMTAIIAVLTGMLLAKIKTRAIFLHGGSVLFAYVLMVWQTRYLTPDGWFIAKTSDMVSRFQVWVTAAESGGISADPLPFVIIVFIFTWIVTYVASWFVFRSLRFWPAVIPAGLALFLNLLYLPEKFWVFFYMFILMVILLSMRMYFLRKRAAWDRKEVPYVRGISPAFGFHDAAAGRGDAAGRSAGASHGLRARRYEEGLDGHEHPVEGHGDRVGPGTVIPTGAGTVYDSQVRGCVPVQGSEQSRGPRGDADIVGPAGLLESSDLRRLHTKGVADGREGRPKQGIPAGRGRGDSGLQRNGAFRAVGGDGCELGCDLCGCEPAAR